MVAPRISLLGAVLIFALIFGTASAREWRLETVPKVAGQQDGNLAAVSCSARSACTAVGSVDNRHGATAGLAEHWDGTRWSIQTTPRPPGVPGFAGVDCLTAVFCAGVGTGVGGSGPGWTERWNGHTWSASALPGVHKQPIGMQAVSCWKATGCMAVGGFGQVTFLRPLAELWNGGRWSAEMLPPPHAALDGYLLGVSCSGPSNCVAVGDYASGTGSGGAKALAEQWNGSRWSVMAIPSPNGDLIQLNGISCPSTNWCEAAGSYEHAGHGTFFGLVENWDGRRWTIQHAPGPPVGRYTFEFLAIGCAARRSCTAVGDSADQALNGHVLAERLSGTRWAVQKAPNPAGYKDNSLNGVSCTSGGDCTAVGSA